MSRIAAGPVPMLVRQVSTVMDGTGVPSKEGVDFIPVSAGQGNLIYADPADNDVVIGTAAGGLFEFSGHAQVRDIYAACGEGSTLEISVIDGDDIKRGPKGTYQVEAAADANSKVIHLEPSVSILPGQKLKTVVTAGAGNMFVAVSVIKYPDQA